MLVAQVAHTLGAMVASPLRGEFATFPEVHVGLVKSKIADIDGLPPDRR
jgi:hypothetical protein